jgi:hypothetical protein
MDQQWLEALLEQISAASDLNDHARVQKLRTELEWDFSAHLKAAETFLIPALLRSDAPGALVLLQSQEHLRERLAELDASIDCEFVPRGLMSRFIDDLRAHGRLGASLWDSSSDDTLDESYPDSGVTAIQGGLYESVAMTSAAA